MELWALISFRIRNEDFCSKSKKPVPGLFATAVPAKGILLRSLSMFDRVRVGIDPNFTRFPDLQDIALTDPMTDRLTVSGIFCEIRPSGEFPLPPLVLGQMVKIEPRQIYGGC
jgi:hypothetical protein